MQARGQVTFELQTDLRVHVVPAFRDNYLYVLEQPSTAQCCVIDPGDAEPILDFLRNHKLNLNHILLTHHHRDHTGGVEKLLQQFGQAKILCSEWMTIGSRWHGADIERIKANTQQKCILNTPMTALDVRGHTLDHIAFIFSDREQPERSLDAFVGDSIFGAGCGGLFEGTYEQMLTALRRLRSLSAGTRLWCAHEYTLKNLQVAVRLGEANARQAERLSTLEQNAVKRGLEAHEIMTIPLEITDEIETNPFLRWDSPGLQKAIDTSGSLETFTYVRKFRDQF